MDVITYPCKDPDVGKVKGEPHVWGVITEVHYLENVEVLHNPLSYNSDVTLTHGFWNHKQHYVCSTAFSASNKEGFQRPVPSRNDRNCKRLLAFPYGWRGKWECLYINNLIHNMGKLTTSDTLHVCLRCIITFICPSHASKTPIRRDCLSPPGERPIYCQYVFLDRNHILHII